MIPEVLDREQVATYLQVNKATVDRWRKDGTIRYVQIGRKIRFRRSDVVSLLNGHHDEDAVYERLGKGESEGAKHLKSLVDWLADRFKGDLDGFGSMKNREWLAGCLHRELETLTGLVDPLSLEEE